MGRDEQESRHKSQSCLLGRREGGTLSLLGLSRVKFNNQHTEWTSRGWQVADLDVELYSLTSWSSLCLYCSLNVSSWIRWVEELSLWSDSSVNWTDWVVQDWCSIAQDLLFVLVNRPRYKVRSKLDIHQ